MKGNYPILAEKVLSMPVADLAISSVTVFEFEYGAAKKGWGENTRRKMHMMLSPFEVIPFDTKDAVVAGEIRAELAKRGVPIGVYDILIAAQGIARGLTVVTHNTREFIRVPNIKLEDWI